MDNQNPSGLKDLIEKFKIPIALSLVGIVLIIGGLFLSKPDTKKDFPKESIVEGQKMISVDVSGSVNKPGVYQLDLNSRIEDAILAAGGFTELANQEYISKYLNMAQKLADGSKVYVPPEGETGASGGGQGGTVAGATVQTAININTATQVELEALPGIGPVTASKIISDRPYQAVDELLNKKIVTKSVFEKIKDQIVLY